MALISGALSFTTTTVMAALITRMLDVSCGSNHYPRTCSADSWRVLAMTAQHMGIIAHLHSHGTEFGAGHGSDTLLYRTGPHGCHTMLFVEFPATAVRTGVGPK